MSNVSIFEKKWIDLVFEGKNQEYGAYQLRRESPRTTMRAFFFTLFSIGFISGIFMLLSSFGPKPHPVPPEKLDSLIVTVYNFPPEELEKEKKAEPYKEAEPVEEIPENKLPVVAPTPDVVDEIERNVDKPNTNPPLTNNNAGGGNGTDPNVTGSKPGVSNGGEEKPTGPVIAAVLDAQPEFPGGMKKFYDYVGKNFKELDMENVDKVTVMVSFVIERDGGMTDIRVLRNPGYELDKEAIRVLKSLKTKWKPGILNGEPVRTQYTLPITVKIN
jgi:periplasmic protein TonB